MIELRLDKEFKPAIVELRKFDQDVKKSGMANKLLIAVERNDGYTFTKELNCFKDGIDDERNIFMVERMIKTILWVVGGYKIYIAGSHKVYEEIKKFYSVGGYRDFDRDFMETVYEKPFEVIECTYENIPKEKASSLPIGGHLEGKRIGFDAGGSDRKVSAVVNGETIYSEETVWFPKLNSDPKYHFDGIYDSFKTSVSKMGGDCDAIGVSSAGVYINNKPMVASLFIKVPKELQKEYIQPIYLNAAKKLSEELGHEVPIEVANDGDVTALAGAIDLKDNSVLGIAMGTSEAVGYVDENGNLTGWLSELAFVPCDFNKDSMKDEWSGDFGVGCKYFSQDAVIKLAKYAGLEIDESLSLADKLKYVQKLNNEGNPIADEIFKTIGVYLGYTIAYYCEYYNIKHVLILGRVTSGKGGDTILKIAKETMDKEFPEYKTIDISMPSEYMRRVGQSIAAASLTEIKK